MYHLNTNVSYLSLYNNDYKITYQLRTFLSFEVLKLIIASPLSDFRGRGISYFSTLAKYSCTYQNCDPFGSTTDRPDALFSRTQIVRIGRDS